MEILTRLTDATYISVVVWVLFICKIMKYHMSSYTTYLNLSGGSFHTFCVELEAIHTPLSSLNTTLPMSHSYPQMPQNRI